MKYNEKERIEIEARVELVTSFKRHAFRGFDTETVNVYKLRDSEGNALVWKTTASLYANGGCEFDDFVREGDMILLKATVKGFDEYKGERQVMLTRATILAFMSRGELKESKEDRKAREIAERAAEQLASLEEGDTVETMYYSRYKKHYADCETVAGSFTNSDGRRPRPAMIDVIIRAGRMKPNGVRGKRINPYIIEYICDGKEYKEYRYAIDLEHATNNFKRDHKAELDKIEIVKAR